MKIQGVIVCVVIGVAAAFAVGQWPDFAGPIEMSLFSAMVLVPSIWGMWSHRSDSKFLIGVSSAILLHIVVLVAMQRVFPFKTILLIIPIALLETSILLTVMLIIFGYGRE